ncbi:MAG: hypothetical protein EBS53_00760 [Bacteroidetes bacterium]|nr:hypothetical protein [Bacteroidota bacterium]
MHKICSSFLIQFYAVLLALITYSLLGFAAILLWKSYAPQSYGIVVDALNVSKMSSSEAQVLFNAIQHKGILSLDTFSNVLNGFYGVIIMLLTAFIAFLAIYLQISMRLFSRVQIEDEVKTTLTSQEMKDRMGEVFRTESRSTLSAINTDISDLRASVESLTEAAPANLEMLEQLREAIESINRRINTLEERQ